MSNTVEALKTAAPYFVIAGAWITAWVQIAVVPFYKKRKELYDSFEASGELEQGRSRILSVHTLPVVETIVRRVLDNRTDDEKRKSKNFDVMGVLNSIDIMDDLTEVEASVVMYKKLDYSYARLKRTSGPVVYCGLTHIVATILFAVAVQGAISVGDVTGSLVVVGAVWAITLLGMIALLALFHRWTTQLYDQLGELRRAEAK